MNKKSRTFSYYYEKFRAFLLILLIVLCIVQIGILWSSQSGSLPFLSSLFPDSKNSSQASLDKMKEDFLRPYRVVLSKGYDDDHLIVPNGSDEYKTLWDGAKGYLAEALKNKPSQIQPISEEKWGLIVAKNPYYFEFRTEIPIDIVNWVIDLKNASDSVASFNRIVIYPDDPENSYYDTLYLRDKNSIYTYTISDYDGGALETKEFNSLYNRLDPESNPDSHNYKIAIETGSKTSLPKDMIAPLSSSSEEKYSKLNTTPFVGVHGDTSSLADYEAIQLELFGEVRNDYYPDEDAYGSVVFKKSDSIYRIYKNSVIEYKYIGNQGITEKSRLLEAYQKAISFLMEITDQSKYMSGVNLYLSSVSEQNNSYTFKFDYSIPQGGGMGDVPVLVKNFIIPNSETPLNNAITVEATSKKVLLCRWIALNPKANRDYDEYIWNFPEYVDKAYNSITELKSSSLPIKDYGIYYVITDKKLNDNTLIPSFVLFNESGNFDIPLN